MKVGAQGLGNYGIKIPGAKNKGIGKGDTTGRKPGNVGGREFELKLYGSNAVTNQTGQYKDASGFDWGNGNKSNPDEGVINCDDSNPNLEKKRKNTDNQNEKIKFPRYGTRNNTRNTKAHSNFDLEARKLNGLSGMRNLGNSCY